MKKILTLLFLIQTIVISAQEKKDSIGYNFNSFNKLEKKFLWGFQFNNSWTTVDGIDSLTVFTKPSLGGGIKFEYFPKNWLGVSVGIGHQQRGFGVITPDIDKSLGNPDSTHRLRIRSNNLNIPLLLMLRTPFDIFNGGKFSIGFGISPTKVYSAKRVFHSIEDGFHDIQVITDRFISGWDMPVRIAAGLDINAANSCLFRVHFIADFGSKLIYINPNTGTASGKNKLFGIELNFLF